MPFPLQKILTFTRYREENGGGGGAGIKQLTTQLPQEITGDMVVGGWDVCVVRQFWFSEGNLFASRQHPIYIIVIALITTRINWQGSHLVVVVGGGARDITLMQYSTSVLRRNVQLIQQFISCRNFSVTYREPTRHIMSNSSAWRIGCSPTTPPSDTQRAGQTTFAEVMARLQVEVTMI